MSTPVPEQSSESAFELAYIANAEAEHAAWLAIVQEWRALQRVGVLNPDFNDARLDVLIGCIKVWGEELVGLRDRQTASARSMAKLDMQANLADARGRVT